MKFLKLFSIVVLTLIAFTACQNDAQTYYSAKVWEATAAEWAVDKEVYAQNDLLFCSDCMTFKKGDGVHVYSQLKAIGVDSTMVAQKVNKTGDIMNGTLNVLSGNATGTKLWIGMYNSGTGHSNAPKTLDAAGTYLSLGGREYGDKTIRMIGFGYVSTLSDIFPGQIGYQEISTSGNTNGDLIFATRPSTSNIAPTIRMRITAAGNVKSYGAITAPEDLVTKGYVDTAYTTVKTVTGSGTISLLGTPSKTLLANNSSGATTWTLPPAKLGITYTFWKIGGSIMTITGAITDAGKNGTKIVSGSETGSSITVVCVGSSWLITAKNGSWTTE